MTDMQHIHEAVQRLRPPEPTPAQHAALRARIDAHPGRAALLDARGLA